MGITPAKVKAAIITGKGKSLKGITDSEKDENA